MANWIIDRTINLDDFKTKSVLNELLIEPRKTDAELENILHQKGVLKNKGDGALRRRWYTYLRNYGLLSGDDVTEMGKLYALSRLSLSELALLQLAKKKIKIENNVSIFPLKVLVGILSIFTSINQDEAYLTREEFTNYVVFIKSDSENDIRSLANDILQARNNGIIKSNIDGQHDDIWFNTLSQTKLFELCGRAIFVDNFEMLTTLNNYYNSQTDHIINYGLFSFGLIEKINLPIMDNSTFDLDYVKTDKNTASILFDFLFTNTSLVKIEEKYYGNKKQNLGVKTLLSKLRINIENKGMYANFKGYPNIVLLRLINSDDFDLVEIAKILQTVTIENDNITNEMEVIDIQIFDFTESTINDGQNLIVYGTPGCGKSYYVEHTLLEDYPKENYIRTTFFQDYTNTDFVGQILPVVEGEKVTYKFNPGPFTLALEKAIENPQERFALVIEELNRGSAASIFGDIFQLLDRKDGVSEYSINNVNIINYLKEKFEGRYTFDSIRLPGNLSIFATMNTSDQNVFTLDTAFKRRWKFKKLLNKFDTDHQFKDKYVPGADITWKDFVNGINKFILESSAGLNSEDKQLGVYFVDENGMRKEKVDTSDPKAVEDFAYKVLEYLWADVAKFDRSKWFAENIKSLDDLVDEYKTNGIGAFNHDVFNK